MRLGVGCYNVAEMSVVFMFFSFCGKVCVGLALFSVLFFFGEHSPFLCYHICGMILIEVSFGGLLWNIFMMVI